MRRYVHRYAEPVSEGRSIMRVDYVWDGELVLSHTEGSPAPTETVKAHEQKVAL
jgi:hypothetical protein